MEIGREEGTSIRSELTGAQLAERLLERRRHIDLEEIEFSLDAARFAATDEYDEQGFDSPISWIKASCHMSGGAAADRVCVGEQLLRLPESTQALRDSEIGFAHLALTARTAEATGARFQEHLLLRQARILSVARFRIACLHARHVADAEAYAADMALATRARRLRITACDDGFVLLNGILDAVGGAALQTALEPLARPLGKDDEREHEQRLADALVELAGGARPAQLQVTTSLETLLRMSGAPGAETEFSLPLAAKTVERLGCDSSVARILLDSDSMVIDVGRSKRVVSGPTRRALKSRDGCCRWPHCDRPTSLSAVHHLVHWIHGGRTDLDNLILLCHRHHRMVHEDGWQIVRKDSGEVLTIAPPTGFERWARGPD
jgi:hypothetical protein